MKRMTYRMSDQYGNQTDCVAYDPLYIAPKYTNEKGEIGIFPESKREELALIRLAAYEDTGLEPETIKSWMLTQNLIDSGITPALIGTPLKHLFELASAEAEGLLLVLPCEENTPMWRVNIGMDGKPVSISPTYFNLTYYRPEDVGTKLFFTREEAEAVLPKEVSG